MMDTQPAPPAEDIATLATMKTCHEMFLASVAAAKARTQEKNDYELAMSHALSERESRYGIRAHEQPLRPPDAASRPFPPRPRASVPTAAFQSTMTAANGRVPAAAHHSTNLMRGGDGASAMGTWNQEAMGNGPTALDYNAMARQLPSTNPAMMGCNSAAYMKLCTTEGTHFREFMSAALSGIPAIPTVAAATPRPTPETMLPNVTPTSDGCSDDPAHARRVRRRVDLDRRDLGGEVVPEILTDEWKTELGEQMAMLEDTIKCALKNGDCLEFFESKRQLQCLRKIVAPELPGDDDDW